MYLLQVIYPSKNELQKNNILWISLIPFLFVRSPLGRLIFINGVLCHHTGKKILVYWDIITNVILGVYISLTSNWKPYASIIITLSTLIWQYNRLYTNNKINHTILHILGVQWPLAYVGYKF